MHAPRAFEPCIVWPLAQCAGPPHPTRRRVAAVVVASPFLGRVASPPPSLSPGGRRPPRGRHRCGRRRCGRRRCGRPRCGRHYNNQPQLYPRSWCRGYRKNTILAIATNRIKDGGRGPPQHKCHKNTLKEHTRTMPYIVEGMQTARQNKSVYDIFNLFYSMSCLLLL